MKSQWIARRHLGEILRVVLLTIPVIAGFVVALATRRLLEAGVPQLPWVIVGLTAMAAAIAVVVGLDRSVRRLLPLAMLMKLAVVFTDQVPNRLTLAMRAASPRRPNQATRSLDLRQAKAEEHVVDLIRTLTEHDRFTRGHSERVRAVTMMIADEMNIKGEERDRLEWGALLHDIGKIEVSPLILNKQGAPDHAEWLELSTHPTQGVALANELTHWLGDSVHAIDQHHERFDGSGYPGGLAGTDIALSARIVAVADAYEVMTANRSYKTAMSPAQARRELHACSGSQFDPEVVRAFASLSVVRFSRFLGVAAGLVAMLV